MLEFCGQPAAARQWIETVPAGDDYEGMMTAAQIPMEEWDYQNDPDQFVNKVIFRDGVVAEIRELRSEGSRVRGARTVPEPRERSRRRPLR